MLVVCLAHTTNFFQRLEITRSLGKFP